MRHRSVADLMTPTAVSARRGTPFKEIARLLDEFYITAVPIVDESERPVGVVSEADLLRRRDGGSGATAASDVMTSPAITADPEWTLSGAVGQHSLVPIVVRLCQSVDGVVDVINRLNYEHEDMSLGSPTATER
ncbi:CBS domain-containing protein [Streptomyces sp. NPDC093093]|uniref:CBS domain-containing protein n=1 Tax=Streptomyces sp. NPDC093093 TaxID=3366025 RepID=UPI00381054D9